MANHAKDTLSRKGIRATRPRLAIFDALLSKNAPINIRELSRDPLLKNIDSVTIYRTLELFEKEGLVRHVELGRREKHYESLLGRKDHHHVVCMSCKRVEDFTGCNYAALAPRALKQVSGFALITSHSFELFGLCVPCSKK